MIPSPLSLLVKILCDVGALFLNPKIQERSDSSITNTSLVVCGSLEKGEIM